MKAYLVITGYDWQAGYRVVSGHHEHKKAVHAINKLVRQSRSFSEECHTKAWPECECFACEAYAIEEVEVVW